MNLYITKVLEVTVRLATTKKSATRLLLLSLPFM